MMYLQQAHISFREINFSATRRKVANLFHKILLAIQESRKREVARILAQYGDDHTLLIRNLRKF